MIKKQGRAKALLGIVVALAMSLALVPAVSAFGLGDLQSWVAPSSKSATSFEQNGKTYSYVTSATRKVTESTADVLGICNVTVCPTAANPFTYTGDAQAIYDSIKTNARFGIYGSDVNQNMNPYYANYFYNQWTLANGGTDVAAPRDTVLVDANLNPGAPNTALTRISAEYGTSPTLYYRPDILYAVTSLTDSDGNAISYGAATASTSAYSDLVAKIRNKELGEYEGVSLYQEGDENYDPYYVMAQMDSYTADIVNNLYSLASAAEAVIERSANTGNPKVTRYEDPMQIAGDYEAYLRGSQYAVLAAIDNGTVARKTVGIVSAADATENTITFVKSKNAKGAYTNDYAEFLGAVTDNICDVDGLADGIGTAKDLLNCDVVFIYGYGGFNSTADDEVALKDTLTTILKNYGATNEKRWPEISVQGPKTVIHHDRGGSVENSVLVGALIGFAYPEVINPVDSLAYFYENFYHIKANRLQDALGMNLAAMSLPKGVELSLDTYDELAYQNILAGGIAYYQANSAAIEEQYPLLAATKNMTIFTVPLIDDADVVAADTPFNKSLQEVIPTVTYKGTQLVYGKDFIVNNNVQKNAGTYTMTVVGKGNYAGSKAAQFKIVKGTQPITVSASTQTLKAADLAKVKKTVSALTVTGAAGRVTYAKVGKSDLSVNKANGKITVNKNTAKGTYTVKVKVSAAGNADYNAATKTVTVIVKVK